MSFYQTINQTDEEISASNKKNKKQEDLIYDLFVQCDQPLSPSMVLNKCGLNCPITSIRRAISDLTKDGKLIKTDRQIKGMYSRAEHLWELPEMDEPNQITLFATPKQKH